MELRVLGPLEVVQASGTVKVGSRKDRVVLATLALEAGRVVSEERLAEAVWGPSPPRTAAKSIQNSIVQLRKTLGGGPDLTIETAPNGYRLEAAFGVLDSARAAHLIGLARGARRGGADREASVLYREALALWRAQSLADVAELSAGAMAGAVRLEELRWSAAEELMDAELALGRHYELPSELEILVAGQPLRERLWGQLIVALYRSGRQGEALRAYQRARRRLVDELGIEPGTELRRLEQAVIDQDPALELAAGARRGGASQRGEAGDTPGGFVGRDRELARLASAVADGRRGRARVLLVCGEPGIGKTRLIDQIATQAAATGSRVVWGRAWEGGGAPALWPWTQALRALMDELGVDELRRLAGTGAPALAALLPEMGPRESAPGPGAGSADEARFTLFDAVCSTLKRAAADTPVVLVLDDLHAADRDSLELLGFLGKGLRGAHLTVLATYRDREVARDPALSRLVGEVARQGETIPLTGLTADAVRRLLGHVLGAQLATALGTAIVDTTQGNPLFVTELARLVQNEPGFLDGKPVAPDRLPSGVRETIRQLVGPLSPEARDLLATAAVVGRDFTTATLARASDQPPQAVGALLAEAAVAGLVEPGPASGCYSFHHVLVQETLYGQLGPEARSSRHAAIATILEEQHGLVAGPHAAVLAHHGARAANVLGAVTAVRYCVLAAQAAVFVFAWDEAAQQYRQALRVCDEHSVDRRWHAAVLEALGDLLIDAGIDLNEGVEHLEAALRLHTKAADREAAAWVHARLARARSSFLHTMNMTRALEHYRLAENVLGLGPASARLGYLYAGYASASNTLLRTEDTGRVARRGMDIAEAIDDAHLWNSAAVNHAHSLVLAGELREGLDGLGRVWAASDHEGFLVPAFMAVWYLAFWYSALGHPAEAKRWVARELACSRHAAGSQNRTLLLHLLADAQALGGELDSALRTLDGLPVVPPLAESRAAIAFVAGDWSLARSLLADFLGVARQTRNGVAETLGLLRMAPILLAEDDLRGAVALCDEALALLPEARCNAPLVYTRMPLLRALVRLGDLDRAEAELERVRRLLTPGEDWLGLGGRVQLVEAELAMASGRPSEAAEGFHAADATFHRYGLVVDRVALHLDRAQLLDAAGLVLAAQEERNRAGQLLRRIGARGRWVQVAEGPQAP